MHRSNPIEGRCDGGAKSGQIRFAGSDHNSHGRSTGSSAAKPLFRNVTWITFVGLNLSYPCNIKNAMHANLQGVNRED
jgi:hypothetical protein